MTITRKEAFDAGELSMAAAHWAIFMHLTLSVSQEMGLDPIITVNVLYCKYIKPLDHE